ncbi:MAG: cell division protein ZapE [Thiotrichales bacterium]|nr:MAG: cell division protein ZapE [Thiotrichales bacterium]
MLKLTTLYQQEIKKRNFNQDAKQELVIAELQTLQNALQNRKKSIFDIFNTRKSATGIYLWGKVGRGKTFIMDLFFQSLAMEDKLRLHFQHFMHYIHQELRNLPNHKNPIEKLVKKLSKNTSVLCLDEFFVTDITDAMLLKELLLHMFKYGITLVITSNTPPQHLYQHGLQRESFLPAISLLQQHTKILQLDNQQDYREQKLQQSLEQENINKEQTCLQKIFNTLVKNKQTTKDPLHLHNRNIPVIQRTKKLIWFDFFVICGAPRSTTDYLNLSKNFTHILISNIPILTIQLDDYARRFINLIDVIYDANINLLFNTDIDINNLYTGKRLNFEIKRTKSRLKAMLSNQKNSLSQKICNHNNTE